MLKVLHEQRQYPWCRKMLARFRRPPTVHDESHYRVWQRGATVSAFLTVGFCRWEKPTVNHSG
jgi:hypothetical protein